AGRVVEAVRGQVLHELLEFHAGGEQAFGDALDVGADVLGVEAAEDHVGPLEDELVVPLGDAHHVADDLQGQAGGDLGDEVAAGAGDEEVVDDLLGGGLDVRLELLDHLGREGAGDDAPQAG